jgi:predicted SnoaL-like aldol condensation-catalyzing enzyme
MTDTDPRTLAHRMHAAFNERNVDAADDIFAPDFHSHPLQGGRDQVKASWTAMITARPTARSVVEDVLVDGDRAALRSTIYGLSADDPDAAAGTIMEIIRVADGRIAELWGATTIAHQPR